MKLLFTTKLTEYDLVYLATPYSKYPDGIEQAFQVAAAVAAALVREKVSVYSPIAHTHPIAVHGGLDPLDHSLWLAFDETMMDKADALAVVMMTGWRELVGIRHEIEWFKKNDKPVFYIDVQETT